MNVLACLKNALYFVPVVGTVHHARQEQQLAEEFRAISSFAPSLTHLGGRATLISEERTDNSLAELSALSVDQKIRISNYMEKRNRVNQLAFWGSNVQVITLCGAQVYHPVLLLLARCEYFHTLYTLFKLCVAPARYYHYNQTFGVDGTRRREFFGESRFLSFARN